MGSRVCGLFGDLVPAVVLSVTFSATATPSYGASRLYSRSADSVSTLRISVAVVPAGPDRRVISVGIAEGYRWWVTCSDWSSFG